MKLGTVFLMLLCISCGNTHEISNNYSCEEIVNGIFDLSVYDNIHGELILRPSRNNENFYKIIPEGNSEYFVSATVVKDIRSSLTLNSCNNLVEIVEIKYPTNLTKEEFVKLKKDK